jgi:hypothetical protein
VVRPAVVHPTPEQLLRAEVVDWAPESPYMYRIFHQDTYAPHAESFRRFGPLSRYDHQVVDPATGGPALSDDRGCMYLSADVGTALAEVFGDDRRVKACPHWMLGRVEVTVPIPLLDLTDANVMSAGTFGSILAIDREDSQTWARSVYDTLDEACGITYVGSHDYGRCFVLWERAKDQRPGGDVVRTVTDAEGNRSEFGLNHILESLAATPLSLEVMRSLRKRRIKFETISENDCPECQNPARRP